MALILQPPPKPPRADRLLNPDCSRLELYDIPAGPSEINNRAAEHPGIVERLAHVLMSWRETLPPGPVHPDAGRSDYPWPK